MSGVRVPLLTALCAGLIAFGVPAIAQPGQAPAWLPGGSPPHRGMLAGLTPQGRRIVQQAIRSVKADGTRQQIEAVRANKLDLMAADPLDVAALTRAMTEERSLVAGQESRKAAAILGALQQLSPADRAAYVAAVREAQARVQERIQAANAGR